MGHIWKYFKILIETERLELKSPNFLYMVRERVLFPPSTEKLESCRLEGVQLPAVAPGGVLGLNFRDPGNYVNTNRRPE